MTLLADAIREMPEVRSLGDRLDPAYLGWMQESSGDEPVESLRQRMLDDGYLLLRGLLDLDLVLEVRA